MSTDKQIQKEITIIDSLLHDEKFAEEMAMNQYAAYYKGIGQTAPPFITKEDDSIMVKKTQQQEKIATNIAGFYALECGLTYLYDHSELTITEWLEKIINNNAPDSVTFLMNRFANATWKAGQPFRDIKRIQKSNFISASSLSAEEVEKDHRQILLAAKKLSSAISKDDKAKEMQQLKSLMRDSSFTAQMAGYMDSAYNASAGTNSVQAAPQTAANDTITKSMKDEKIATNIAGFYALECAINYFVTTKHQPPSQIMQALLNDKLTHEDKIVFARFANATWKAGQPFRGLDRITRDTFIPFTFLSDEEVEKDIVQVKAAAEKLLATINAQIALQ